MNIIKKDGTLEEYDYQKIINAVHKASQRVMIDLSMMITQKFVTLFGTN